jgi:hypothetical protein
MDRRGVLAMIRKNAEHLYRPGETVLLDASLRYFLKSDATFTIVAQLPPLGNDLQYRIKSNKEPYERVALEHQLAPERVEADVIAERSRERAFAGL